MLQTAKASEDVHQGSNCRWWRQQIPARWEDLKAKHWRAKLSKGNQAVASLGQYLSTEPGDTTWSSCKYDQQVESPDGAKSKIFIFWRYPNLIKNGLLIIYLYQYNFKKVIARVPGFSILEHRNDLSICKKNYIFIAGLHSSSHETNF